MVVPLRHLCHSSPKAGGENDHSDEMLRRWINRCLIPTRYSPEAAEPQVLKDAERWWMWLPDFLPFFHRGWLWNLVGGLEHFLFFIIFPSRGNNHPN